MIGKTVSHYDVLYRLGSGGMGDVFAARDTLLGRMVAMKVLQMAGHANAEDRLRFLQEARAASALNHPSIVTIYDVVRDGDADCIVMELVGGETLDARIRRAVVPLRETLAILDRIADALAVAHGQGIVHRDLKPANVMLTPSGGVKILDFGLAKIVASGEADMRLATSPRTQSGLVIGTPMYMSPEQALGKPLDGRSDIFSLGTIAMEMLTGSNPFEAESVVATMHNIVYADPAPAVLQKVPDAARGLVTKMLARKKEERFATAEELRAAIATVRDGGRIAAPARPSPRRRQVAIGAAVFVLLAAIGLGASQVWRPRATAATLEPVAAPAQAFTPPLTAQEHVRRANDLLAAFWRKGYVEQAIEEYQRAISLDASHASAHAGLAIAYWRRYNVDLDRDKAWLDLARKNALHAVELDPQLAAGRVALAIAELKSGNADAARKELEQTLVIDPANAAAHRWLADVATAAKDDVTAEAELRKALALRPRDPELHSVLGAFLYRAARYDEAAAAFRQAIALAPDYASPHRNLGAVLHMRGDYPGAARALQQSLEIEPSATVYSNLGTLYFFQGLYPQSVAAFEKAVQLGANNHVVWANLGDAYRWTPGNQAKAREAFTTALHLLDGELETSPNDGMLLANRALYHAKRGDAKQALASADALMRQDEKNPQNLYSLAVAFELSGGRAQSLRALAAAIRNGYSTDEIEADPELVALRRDVQYQRLMVAAR